MLTWVFAASATRALRGLSYEAVPGRVVVTIIPTAYVPHASLCLTSVLQQFFLRYCSGDECHSISAFISAARLGLSVGRGTIVSGV